MTPRSASLGLAAECAKNFDSELALLDYGGKIVARLVLAADDTSPHFPLSFGWISFLRRFPH